MLLTLTVKADSQKFWKKSVKFCEIWKVAYLKKRLQKSMECSKTSFQRILNVPVDGVFIKEKALQYAKDFGFNEFQASDGWLHRWKVR